MKLALPYPISANRYWRQGKTREGYPFMHISKEAELYKEEVGWIAKQAGIKSPLEFHVELRLVLHPVMPKSWREGQEVRCIDLDNSLKVAIDALNGVCYLDDSQIRRMVVERGVPVPMGSMEIEITRYEERRAA